MTAIFARLLGRKRAFWPVVAGIVLYVLLVGADAAVMRAGAHGHPGGAGPPTWAGKAPPPSRSSSPGC